MIILAKLELAMLEPETREPLAGIDTGEFASVLSFLGSQNFIHRLTTMGFTPGVVLKMQQNFRKGPVIVIVRGTRIALGRGEAEKIIVSCVPHE